MSTSPLAPELLSWLATVLNPRYQQVNRTYSDVATVLHHYRSLSPKTDVYTYDDGRSDLLLCIHGTLPVSFRGSIYNIPLELWIPYQYPSLPPTARVVPSKVIGIRQTIHVNPDGRCYHPYLAYWAQNPDKSFLVDLCGQLKDVFSKEPPVYSKQPQNQAGGLHHQIGNSEDAYPISTPLERPAPSDTATAPPPRPPLPQEIEAQRFHPPPPHVTPPPAPPPPPPKARISETSPAPSAFTTAPHLYGPGIEVKSPSAAAVLAEERPIVPQKVPYQESGVASVRDPHINRGPRELPPIPSPGLSSPANFTSQSANIHTVSPPSGSYATTSSPSRHVSMPPTGLAQQSYVPTQRHNFSSQFDSIHIGRFPISHVASARPLSFHGYPTQQSPTGPARFGSASLSNVKSQPQVNLLDKDDIIAAPIPVIDRLPPPLPPNPEKDRLTNEIAKGLRDKTDAASRKTTESLEQTSSQAAAMARTEAYMERERTELRRINDICDKDQRILNERISMASDLIREVRDREAPNIDSVVVAPTVVHNQLYELVTDDLAIEDTIYILGKALDKERINLDVFLKHTRALAREQFLKRALVKRISRQIGMV